MVTGFDHGYYMTGLHNVLLVSVPWSCDAGIRYLAPIRPPSVVLYPNSLMRTHRLSLEVLTIVYSWAVEEGWTFRSKLRIIAAEKLNGDELGAY